MMNERNTRYFVAFQGLASGNMVRETCEGPDMSEGRYEVYSQSFIEPAIVDEYDQISKKNWAASMFDRRQLASILVAKAEINAVRRVLPKGRITKALDAPCGAGKMLPTLRSRTSTSVVGMDVSRAMLSRCIVNGGNTDFVQGDIRRIPFEGDSFDVVVTNRFLHRIDPGRHSESLVELRRVTGRYLVIYFAVRTRSISLVMKLEKMLNMGDRGKIFYLSRSEVEEEIALFGLKIVKCARVFPFLSAGLVMLLEKVESE